MIVRPLLLFAMIAMIASVFSRPAAAEQTREFYEVRSYVLGEKGDAEAINGYLKNALLPALERQGVGPIGVFTNSANDQTGSARIITVIPYKSADQIATIESNVQADATFQADAKEYLDRKPNDSPYARISSELLVSMACMPQMKVPAGTLDNDDRVYELRVYESANERLGHLKVDMFNAGEVPIFLDCNITPIFIGQAIVGPQTPSLTYLTVYPSEDDRIAAWKAFLAHPDWQVLKAVEKYQGTVSRIDKFVLVPTPYSQM
jgi:hypothetical protein